MPQRTCACGALHDLALDHRLLLTSSLGFREIAPAPLELYAPHARVCRVCRAMYFPVSTKS